MKSFIAKKRTRGLVTAGIAIGALMGTVALVSGGVASADSAAQDYGDDSFSSVAWSQDQYRVVSATIVKTHPLPAGTVFPVMHPALVVPQDGENHLFEVGMAEQVVAHFWHCAWINEAVAREASGDLNGAQVAATTSLDWLRLPKVSGQKADRADATQYARDTAESLEATHAEDVSWWAVEQATTCGIGE
ncbi:hypothetical protein [Rathayibacter sp. AY1A7]|uniref:hypothetical protein n=1 Tax=Rathayibacter sp. AY1A7 TaxID=2080524 RepID=UPI0011B07176|nr:hypothetical protein [Rathayibacter sp. AY1A7]